MHEKSESVPAVQIIAPPPVSVFIGMVLSQHMNVQSATEFAPPAVNAIAPPLLSELREVKVHEVKEDDADKEDER